MRCYISETKKGRLKFLSSSELDGIKIVEEIRRRNKIQSADDTESEMNSTCICSLLNHGRQLIGPPVLFVIRMKSTPGCFTD